MVVGRIGRARLACVFAVLVLAACGGGGGGGSGTPDFSTAPGLDVNPKSISLTAVQNGALPSSQTVQITITNPNAVGIIAGFPPGVTPPSWLDQNPNVFNCTPSLSSCSFVVAATTTSLAPGTYTTTLRFVIGDIKQNALALRDVQISYTVQPLTGFAATPTSLSFSQLLGGTAPAAQNLAISELGGASYAWNVSISYTSGTGWLNVNGGASASGATLPTTLSVSVNSQVALGTLNATLHMTGNGNSVDIPVSYTVSQPQITRSPVSLTFSVLRLASTPATQDITLTTQGSIPVNYAISVSYGPGPSGWLNVPANGTAPGTVTAGVNTTSLSPGTYTATLAVNTATQSVPVTVTYVVSEPILTRSPASLTFNAFSSGTLPASQDITLSTQQSVSLAYSISVSYGAGASGWLNVPANGTAPATATASVNTTALAPATYTATVSFTTEAQTASVGITYVVAGSSLTFTPAAPMFVIDTTSPPSALSQNIGVGSTGVPLTWAAKSSVPWMSVSPTSGSSGTNVTLTLDAGQLAKFDPGTGDAAITFAYTPPMQAPTNAPLVASLDFRIPKVNFVSPYVERPNTSTEVIVRGAGFNNPTGDILFGATPVSNYTKVSDTEIRVLHPSLAAGSYPVTIPNQLGLDRSRASLRVTAQPTFSAVALPTSLIHDRSIYDGERASVYTNNWLFNSVPGDPRVERHRWNGSVWVTDSILVDPPVDIAMTPDGRELIALTPSLIHHINLDTWTITRSDIVSATPITRIAMANDGRALILKSGVPPRSYDVLTFQFSDIPTASPSSFGWVAPVSSLDGSRILVGPNSNTLPVPLFYFDSSLFQFVQALPDRIANRISYDRTGSISIVDPVVLDRQFNILGIVQNLRQSVISPDGTRAYGVSPDDPTVLHTYDLTSPDGIGGFTELAPIALQAAPGLPIVLSIASDGKTVFVSGESNFIVQPVP
ncbi:MAG TPA: IPT/TIG domain-containing protein [Burkholderiales bacterium]|nr:IPT/TIG domain-containing protein [Burkholderiales bacterium]